MQEPIQIIIALLVGISAILAFLKFQDKKKRIIENGIEVTGIVFEESYHSNINDQSNHKNPVIRFVTKDGLWMTEQADYDSGFLEEGQEINVIYNAENPKEFIYNTSKDITNISYLLLIIGVIAFGIGLWLAYKYLTNQD